MASASPAAEAATAAAVEPAAGGDEPSAAAQLQQQEQDLLLAAQLGQALLQKNEQLSRENEERAAQYAAHLETLEQERHTLRLHISSLQVERDAQVVQLQTDIRALKEQLQQRQHSGRHCDQQRSHIVADLSDQQQRLTRQLRDTAGSQQQLSEQLQQLRQQSRLRSDSVQFHTSGVDTMRAEIGALTEQTRDLERRRQRLQQERAQLVSRLQHTAERQLQLEQQRQQQTAEARSERRRLEELAAANSSLTERLELAAGLSPRPRHAQSLHPGSGSGSGSGCGHHSSLQLPLHGGGQATSLQHELDTSVDEGIGSNTPGSQLASVDVNMADLADAAVDDVECDDDAAASSAQLATLRRQAASTCAAVRRLRRAVPASRAADQPPPPTADPAAATTDTDQPASMEDGAADAVHSDPASMEDVSTEPVAASALLAALASLRDRLSPLLTGAPTADRCGSCQRPHPDPLKLQLDGARGQLHTLQEQHQLQNNSLQQLADELQRHNKLIAMRDRQHAALEEEKRLMRVELDATVAGREALVQKAWAARDQALARRAAAELELARVRGDVLQANAQLLESVQCKVRLSCQLEQWQWDMQQLVEAEIRDKLHRTERQTHEPRRSPGGGTGNSCSSPAAGGGAAAARGGPLRRLFRRSS